MKRTTVLPLIALLLASGCAEPMSRTQKGALFGAGSGGAIGRYMDNQEKAMREALASVEGVNVAREGNTLHVTFRSDSQFDVNSFALRPAAQQDVARMAGILREYNKTAVVIAGHTDATGSESHNQTLSERRAGAVKNIMLAQGVRPDRLTTLGFGMSQPVADNNTVSGRQLNQRVAITINPA